MAASKTAKYVYGVVRSRGARNLKGKGIDDKPLRVVTKNGVGAVTSDVPAGPLEAGRDELLAHSRVLETALEHGVVLPMRFGVVLESESAVRDELLVAHGQELEAQLDEMDGKVEMNVKGFYEEQPILREVLAEQPEIAKLSNSIRGKPDDATYYERIRLGELVAEALGAKRASDEGEFVGRLADHALSVQVGEPVHERMAVNASFLVERDRLGDFDEALEATAREQDGRVRFRSVGPLAPHSFVELSLEA